MRLRSMVLRDENSTWKDVTNKKEARIKALVEEVKDTRSQMDSLRDKCRRQDKLLQNQTRQISNLTVSMASHLLNHQLILSRLRLRLLGQ